MSLNPLICIFIVFFQFHSALTDSNCLILSGYNLIDLYPADLTNFNNLAQLWTVNSPFTATASRVESYSAPAVYMGGLALLGPSTFMKQIYTSLPPHTYISYTLRGISLNRWTSSVDQITVTIDGITQILTPSTEVSTDFICTPSICNFGTYDVLGVQPHSSSSLTLRYTVVNSQYATTSFGVYIQKISIRTQVPYRSSASCHNTPTQIVPCGGSGNQYRDITNSYYGTCDGSCLRCFGPGSGNCYACNSGFTFDGTHCLQCGVSNCLLCSKI